jgi:hypothetical protein
VKATDLKQRLAAEGLKPDVRCIDGPVLSYEGLILEKLSYTHAT